jgi:hypothetical protein
MTRAALFALACVPIVVNAVVSCGGKLGEGAGDGGPAGAGGAGGPFGGGGGPPQVDASRPPPPPSDGGVILPDGSTPTVDATVPPVDSSLPPFDAGGTAYNGFLYFENGGFNGQPTQGSFFAEFFPGPNGIYAGCTIIGQTGTCIAYTCPGSSPIDAGQPQSAGTITISGGALPSGGVPLTGPIYSYSSAGPIYSGGQQMSVVASGGAIPAFNEALVGLDNVTLTSPQPAAGGQYTISTSQDLLASWTGGTAGAQVWIYFTNNGPAQTIAYCAFDAAAGKGDVPQVVVALFKGQSGFFAPIQTNPSAFIIGNSSDTAQIASLAYNFSQATFQ